MCRSSTLFLSFRSIYIECIALISVPDLCLTAGASSHMEIYPMKRGGGWPSPGAADVAHRGVSAVGWCEKKGD